MEPAFTFSSEPGSGDDDKASEAFYKTTRTCLEQ